MQQDFLQLAHADLPVYLTDVYRDFQKTGTRPFHLRLTLYDGTARSFPLRLPPAEGAEEAAFLAEYIHAFVYNLLSSLGARTVDLYFDPADQALQALAAALPEVFQLHTPRLQRTGYGKCLNVNDRVLAALLPDEAGFSFRTHPLCEEPEAQPVPTCTGASILSRLPARAERAMLLGIDVGGTFANDNGKTPGLTAKAKRYVEHWEDTARKNIGLLLFGDVGTGKSFLAGCIANALLEQDVPVLMTNFPTILNRMTGLFGSDRADFLASLNAYDLLILDDLGAERGTEYALEQVFAVIDARYRSRKPLIVTTNLTLDALKHPDDLAHARIYDRILEICAPILFGGENLRVEKANEMKTAARNLLLSDNAA